MLNVMHPVVCGESPQRAYEEAERKERALGALYTATLSQDVRKVESVLNEKLVALGDKITMNGNTALHVAVGTTKNIKFLNDMFNLATKDNQLQQLDMRNSEGSTLLHVAAIVGNTEAAKILVEKNHGLLYAKNNKGQTVLARANMHTDTFVYLFNCFRHNDIEAGDLSDSIRELFVNAVTSKDYDSVMYLYGLTGILVDIDIVLMAIAQNFPRKLDFWERNLQNYEICMRADFKFLAAMKKRVTNYSDAKELLRISCEIIKSKTSTPEYYYTNAILEATRQNTYEVVKKIVSEFPDAIWSANEDGHDIIQYAVINRSEKVYNLLYEMSEHKSFYRRVKDRFENNLLHLAAKLAPPDKLNLRSGAALQIQCELQWFKEVESFVYPLNIVEKNSCEETPQMVFTREHKDLVIEGEKWMKETAQSYTITATLITTIVFAAAITVPGGNKQDDKRPEFNGMPTFSNDPTFTVFAISNAISLFTSVTSLLMFLSILTARFSEQDFLLKLPTKLIIGFATLFISTTAMLVAFGATLYLMNGYNDRLILVLIAGLACLPITSFMTLQFPLIYDLMSSTYGRSMFGKKSDEPFY